MFIPVPLTRELAAEQLRQHDAALRADVVLKNEENNSLLAQLIALRTENEALKQELIAWKHSAIGAGVLEDEIADITTHLATVTQERDALKDLTHVTDMTGRCLKCNMGPMRESCAYPEACEHPGRELALALNSVLLDLALTQARVTELEAHCQELYSRTPLGMEEADETQTAQQALDGGTP